MLQHTGMEYLSIPANAESVIEYQILGVLKSIIPDIQYFLKFKSDMNPMPILIPILYQMCR